MKKKILPIIEKFFEKMLIFDIGISAKENQDLFEVDLDYSEPGMLIGKNGETMQALEHILRLMISKKAKKSINLSLDIAGYKDKREKDIEEMGIRAAKSALKSGRVQLLLPMNAYERRLIHLVLKEFKGIETESIGEEPNRRVMIRVKKKELV